MNETKHVIPSTEVKTALHEVLSAFEAFKSANDQRLDALEKKQGDRLLDDKVERIDRDLNAAQARLDRLLSQKARPDIAAAQPDLTEAKSAWDGYMRSGRVTLELKAGLSTASGSGALAPYETERFVERRLAQVSPMRSLATVRTVGAATFKKPVSTAGVVAGWVAETAARPETDPATLALLEFPAAELYASPAATQALLDDSFINLDEWLASEIEDSFAAQETEAFVNGNGTNKPKGFLNYTTAANASATWGQIGHIVSGAAADFASSGPVDALIDLTYATEAKYRPNAHFVMNRRTAAKIRKFKGSDGQYIWQPSTQAGQLPHLLGYPVQEIEAMPDVGAGNLPVAFGDFAKGYLIVDRAGLSVLRDPYSAKPYVLFYTTKRVGGGVQNFDAIKVLKIAAS
ncbi:phage major capsid protein [Asticcacaulis sp. BYS171W]|uniref:Phage major capsid protein n=1 Tax=Asticcacaulis aquaticus TaxID=2984212 RepID=A0ABT5HUD3_9CAUL|nr:phage major capsid protein [Asticcacaulis aquaticus]MDC7683680.1 phage major capsid protein [Asticcacaulis aquaticus]